MSRAPASSVSPNKLFAKLDISSRSQLGGMLAEEPNAAQPV
jgi:hypothetical protein